MRAAIVLFPGVEELDFAAPFEVLGAAQRLGADLALSLVTLPFSASLTATHGLTVSGLQPAEGDYDLILLPGGGWAGGRTDGVRGAIADGSAGRFAAEQHARGAVLAAVCTGSLILAAVGLLNGRTATTHHSALEDLGNFEGVTVAQARVVDTGSIVTAGGVTSGLDLSLWLVERFFGKAIAGKTEEYLEYTRQGEVLRA